MKKLIRTILKEYISKVVSEQKSATNRPHDKMVINCLLNAGFKVVNTNGKYSVYLKGNQGYYVHSDENDPTKFYFYVGSLSPKILIMTPGTNNCKTIVNMTLGSKQQPVNESQLINENISNDIEEYRMTSRRVSQQLEAFEEMVKRGDLRRANEEKESVYKFIGRLENVLMSLKRRLR